MTTSPLRAAQPRSPFSGQKVHEVIGVELKPGSPTPTIDDERWNLTGIQGLSIQARPDRLIWIFTDIENPRWRWVAREFLLALMAPQHEQRVATSE